MIWLLKHWKPVAGAALLAAAVALASRAYITHGNDRAKQAVAPWQHAADVQRIQQAADDAINQSANAYIEAQHATEVDRITAELDAVLRMHEQTRDRSRRIEEAYRQFQADAAARVSAGAAEVARLFAGVEAARGRVDQADAERDAAGQRDAAALTSLQNEIRPWVRVE